MSLNYPIFGIYGGYTDYYGFGYGYGNTGYNSVQTYDMNFYKSPSIFPQLDTYNYYPHSPSYWDSALIFDFTTNYYPVENNINPFGYYVYSGGGASETTEDKTEETQTAKPKIDSAQANSATAKTKSDVKQKQGNDQSRQNVKVSDNITRQFVSNAQKYYGYNEDDNSFHKFSYSTEWCCDFVSSIIKETYKENGISVPEGIINHRVCDLKDWASDNKVFIRTSDKEDKSKYITQNIKSGDIVILNENGESHTGFVVEVDKKTGHFKTIEGNRYDRVDYGEYDANYQGLSGFVQLS